MGFVRSVNVGRAAVVPGHRGGPSGIDKRPVTGPVELRDPGTREAGLGSGVVGDDVVNRKHHGGSDQAVYAVAREELDYWGDVLGRALPDGAFGENLTISGYDVDAALVGEIWAIGTARLQVSCPRIPCATFAAALGERGWVKRFGERGRTGAYLRVLTAGVVRAGDELVVEHRPEHGVDVPTYFRAVMSDRSLVPAVLAVDSLSDLLRAQLEG